MVRENHTVEPVSNGQHLDDTANASWASGRIERLVTGDLDDADRLDLLAWLDADPARWRRCGLAFLEAQALRESLATDGASSASCGATVSSRRAGSSFAIRARWHAVLAAAAAAIVAFVVGWGLGRHPAGFSEDASMVAGGSPGGAAASPDPKGPAGSQIAAATGDPSGRAASSPGPGSGVAFVRVRVGEGANAREMVVPVLASVPGRGSQNQAAGPMPEYVRRQWERQGYRVIEGRQTIPCKLADGRQVNVPVDRVMLAYVGQPLL